MKKIIHIISSDKGGGAERHLLDVVMRLDCEKYELVVICPDKGYYIDYYEKYTAKVYKLNFEHSDWYTSIILRNIIKDEKPDIIHTHLLKSCIITVFATLSWGGRPKIFSNLHSEVTDLLYVPIWKQKLWGIGYVMLSKFIDTFICVSEYSMNKMLARNIPSNKARFIYNGIDEDKFFPVKREKSTYFNIIFIGRLALQKGILQLIEIAKKLPKDTFIIKVVGAGELEEVLKIAKQKFDLTHLTYTGFIFDVSGEINSSDLLIAPSNGEVFGLVIGEAMACGIPVVASNIGGIPELLIDGKGGFLCHQNDIDCFVSKIKQIQENPNLQETFGNYNRKRFEEIFTLKKMIESIEKLYNDYC
jgi:glycosyltransferase involved in cell wall biosynthesis